MKFRLIESSAEKIFFFPFTDIMTRALDNLHENGYELERISLQKIAEDNGLEEDTDKSLSSTRPQVWGKDIKHYKFDTNKINNWTYSDIMSATRKRNGKIVLENGRHRCKALLNSGYKYIDIPVRTEK